MVARGQQRLAAQPLERIASGPPRRVSRPVFIPEGMSDGCQGSAALRRATPGTPPLLLHPLPFRGERAGVRGCPSNLLRVARADQGKTVAQPNPCASPRRASWELTRVRACTMCHRLGYGRPNAAVSGQRGARPLLLATLVRLTRSLSRTMAKVTG